MSHPIGWRTVFRISRSVPNPSRVTCLRAAVLALVAVVTLGACSSDTGGDRPAGTIENDGTYPLTVPSGDTTITIDAQPASIVSLSPSATEMLYAVGAGDQVVAVDDQSNYPEGVPSTSLSGYTPNVEAVLGYEPDLVVASDDAGDLVAGLARAKVPTLLLPAAATLDDVYTQIERVGAVTGHVADAAGVVASMRSDIDAVVAGLPPRAQPLTYYQELDDTYFSIADTTFIGGVYAMLGLRSIAPGPDAYPQLSAESILAANPDLIFLADQECCGVTPEVVAARPGWNELTAVRDGNVHPLDADVASRWGPRVVDLVRQVGQIVSAVPAESAPR
ncbi:ABC transporter substrate-binding protein [Rhodococcus sp. HNM0569]|uniref:ABC transporter substrate-binding protein n=1 Tax=Rhodococcus sp. HNM0569 TaxID=2716340 RepID=UPI00146CB4A1|nr:ABC transporter substrate-binding protein [Rhodococcus sp. HNM0569]NLU83183.1 ABC transporter substrate-binding protein [Rhodococcus sp. HNM0569]